MSECSWVGGSRRVEKRWSPPFPCCPVSCQCPWKKTLIEKKKKNQKQQFAHVLLNSFVFKSVAKFTGMRMHWSLFSTCYFQHHRKRDASIYNFRWVLRNFLRTLLWWNIYCENLLHTYYNTEISRRWQPFQKTDNAKESEYLRIIDKKLTLNLIMICNSFTDTYFLKYVTKIFCGSKNLGVF